MDRGRNFDFLFETNRGNVCTAFSRNLFWNKDERIRFIHPLCFNDGRPIPKKNLTALKKSLVEQFGGLTNFPQSNEGLWKMGSITFRDKIIIYRVLSDNSRAANNFFKKLKQQMKCDWKQKDVLIVERKIRLI